MLHLFSVLLLLTLLNLILPLELSYQFPVLQNNIKLIVMVMFIWMELVNLVIAFMMLWLNKVLHYPPLTTTQLKIPLQ